MNRFIEAVGKLNSLVLLGWAASGGLAYGADGGRLPLENALSQDLQKQHIAKWCSDVQAAVKELKWKIDPCSTGEGAIRWRIGGMSVQNRPLIFAEFGDPEATNTTLVLSMVHGDEVTPLYVAIQTAHWLQQHIGEYKKTRVILAPLVNPDGFYRKPRTRMNANGVDVNRNFATEDWSDKALKAWKVKYRSDPRRFPGSAPRSEPETVFQEELIKLVRPQKILSVHSPLNHLDYDGPSSMTLARFPKDYVRECLSLRARLKAISSGFFPGSLGNFAGRDMGIPTLTLELPSADARKAEVYWKRFSEGIKTMIQFAVPEYSGLPKATDRVGS